MHNQSSPQHRKRRYVIFFGFILLACCVVMWAMTSIIAATNPSQEPVSLSILFDNWLRSIVAYSMQDALILILKLLMVALLGLLLVIFSLIVASYLFYIWITSSVDSEEIMAKIAKQDPLFFYNSYRIGADELLTLIGKESSYHLHALTLQQRLFDNLLWSEWHGETNDYKTERAVIVGQLNQLSLAALGISFSNLCPHMKMGLVSTNFQENSPTMTTYQSHRVYLTAVHHLILKLYDAEELRTLCFQLGIAYDNLRGEGREGQAREFILMLERHERIDELRQKVTQDRPNAIWPTS